MADVQDHAENLITVTSDPILDGIAVSFGSVTSWIKTDDDSEWNNVFANAERVDPNLPSDAGRWRGMALQTNDTTGVFGAIQGWSGAQPRDANTDPGTETPTGVWTHVAMTWDDLGLDVQVWVNGVPGTPTVSNDVFGLNGPGDWFIGSQPNNAGRDLRGELADFAFFDEQLTEAQIMEIMADGVPGAVSPGQDGDFDSDLDVDGADFLKWQRDLGDATNLALWETNFGTTAAVAAVAVVPEPMSMALFGFGLAALVAARRRRVA